MNENVLQVIQLVDNMLERVKKGEVSTDKVNVSKCLQFASIVYLSQCICLKGL